MINPLLIIGIVIGIVDIGIWVYWRRLRKKKDYKLIDDILKEGSKNA